MSLLKNSQLNQKAVEVCKYLQGHGFQAYLVGGCVRDLIMEVVPKDWDIATNAKPEQVKSIFSKTYDTGLQHGTITVSLGETVEDHFEVTTYRTEGVYSDGRRPDSVAFVDRIEDDLARRDLTINAIAYDPVADHLVDPYGGLQDIKNKVIKAVGNPIERFQEDGLRIMRAARFAARFDSEVELNTLTGMKESLDTLKKVSKERVRDELCKTLMATNPSRGLETLKLVGALDIVCPLLMSEPTLTCFISALNNCSGELETRVALLYANCKDPIPVNKELLSLKFSNKELKKIIFLSMLLDSYFLYSKKNTVVAYKQFIAFIKNDSTDSWENTLEQFLCLTEAMGLQTRAELSRHKDVVVLSRKELKINGDDLLELGVKPGPQIKNILDAVYMTILFNPEANEPKKLLDFAKTLIV